MATVVHPTCAVPSKNNPSRILDTLHIPAKPALCRRRFTSKYGLLFEGAYGQPLVRKGATYDFDPDKCEAHRGALVPWLEPPLVSWR